MRQGGTGVARFARARAAPIARNYPLTQFLPLRPINSLTP